MTRQEAETTATNLKAAAVFTRVWIDEFGFGSGNFEVYTKIENKRTGNNNFKTFRAPLGEKEAKAAAKEAKQIASGKDARTLRGFQADRENQR